MTSENTRIRPEHLGRIARNMQTFFERRSLVLALSISAI
jgi:hypothetical protein